MKQSSLSNWLKVVIAGIGLCGLFVYLWILPSFGKMLAESYPEFAYCYYPWLVMLWVTGIPCYTGLILAWKIAANIGKDRSFTLENGKYLSWIAVLAAADSGFLFIMNIVYLFLNMNHPGIVLASLMVEFSGVAISVAAAVLSHLVTKAAALQEQSDLTI